MTQFRKVNLSWRGWGWWWVVNLVCSLLWGTQGISLVFPGWGTISCQCLTLAESAFLSALIYSRPFCFGLSSSPTAYELHCCILNIKRLSCSDLHTISYAGNSMWLQFGERPLVCIKLRQYSKKKN